MSKQYVFIRLQETLLSCAVGTQHKSKIHLNHITEYALNNSEYARSTLFNPSAIQQHLQVFMHTNGVTKAPLVLCISNQTGKLNDLELLQHALGISKDKTVIASVIHTPTTLFKTTCTQTPHDQCPHSTVISRNLLGTFLPKGYTTLTPWMIGTGLVSCSVIIACSLMYCTTQANLTQIQDQTNNRTTEIKNLLPSAQKTHALEKKLALIQQHEQQNHSNNNATTIPALLHIMADTIPTDAHISHFSLNNRAGNNTSIIEGNKKIEKDTYQIEGFAKCPETINTWLATLSKSSDDTQFFLVSITHLKKAPNTPQGLPYSFVIQANT